MNCELDRAGGDSGHRIRRRWAAPSIVGASEPDSDRPGSVPRPAGDLALSVVIATIGRAGPLKRTLDDLCTQQCQSWECIVVAQDDQGARTAKRHRLNDVVALRVVGLAATSAAAARNRGVLCARGEVVLFLDDDVRIGDPDFLAAHLSNYGDPSVPGVVGQVLAPDAVPRDVRHPRSHHPRVGWLYFPRSYRYATTVLEGGSGNLSVRRDLVLAVGGMDEQFERGAHREDSDFTLRLSDRFGPLTFDPRASVVHVGATEGGCRSWGLNRGVQPLHHVTGEWYFVLKALRAGRILLRDLPEHLFALGRRQVFNRANVRKPMNLLRASLRTSIGFWRAVAKLKEGPRYLAPLAPERAPDCERPGFLQQRYS